MAVMTLSPREMARRSRYPGGRIFERRVRHFVFIEVQKGVSIIKLCVLASGSGGNAIYIESSSGAVLIDGGISCREVTRRLGERGLDPKGLSAVVVSHEHRDHITGVGPLSRRYHVPVFMNQATVEGSIGVVGEGVPILSFSTGDSFEVDGLSILPFRLSHDAPDTVGFLVTDGLTRIGIATDLGEVTENACNHLQGCDLVVLESNHDMEMLVEGPYPWPVKKRIMSGRGHLSNRESVNLLSEIYHPGLRHIVLAHLSQVNNTPDRALGEARRALGSRRRGASLALGCQDTCGDLIEV